MRSGARETEVEEPRPEPLSISGSNLFRSEVILQVEFDAFAEPKVLSPQNLKDLRALYGTNAAVGRALGTSEAFVRQNQEGGLS